MAGFLDRAKEQAQRALNEGKQKVDEVQAGRTGHDLLRRLGAAYYAEQRGQGSPEAVAAAVRALDEHIRLNGDAFLRDKH
ncbi:hypothetical protein [Wenjunlia tyrosinilytica]|nr:hypothetical protein [Wenjunlia tyrosinilytica]